MPVYEKGPVRIHYGEYGSGFPVMLIAGGGVNSTIAGLKRGDPLEVHVFHPGLHHRTSRSSSHSNEYERLSAFRFRSLQFFPRNPARSSKGLTRCSSATR